MWGLEASVIQEVEKWESLKIQMQTEQDCKVDCGSY